MNELWDIEQVAAYLRVPVNTIYQWRTRNYGPPGKRIVKHVRFDPDQVRAWFDSLPSGAA
ncbi:helix-turn-helix transcriptional regulator [Actinosynnema mirum]|uniref:helix-turn-helix transcriptional regulator n=1 Tax=Actinosynnema mirum TaxID=40567 RepID=UPI00019ABAF4|nr:helix-turn-helix domain-containing protein [Actinosynnema mirum]